MIAGGRSPRAGRLQRTQASPLADRLERLTNELVNRAEAEMVARVEVSHAAYHTARWVVIGFAVGSIGLALVLGYAISWSLIGPVQRMDVQLAPDRVGRFLAARRRPESGRTRHPRRQPQPHDRRARAALPSARGRQPPQVRVPCQHVPRAPHATQRHHRLLRGPPRTPLR